MPLMKTKGDRPPRGMTPQASNLGWGLMWLLVKAGSACCPWRLQTRFRWSSDYRWKLDSSLKTIRPLSASFQLDWAKHYSNLAQQWVGVCGRWHNSQYESSFLSISHLWMVMLGSRVRVWWLIEMNQALRQLIWQLLWPPELLWL